jgi:hypothetical protein
MRGTTWLVVPPVQIFFLVYGGNGFWFVGRFGCSWGCEVKVF